MIGELIKERRTRLGLSQVELGRRIGSSQRQISRWENGSDTMLPRRDTLDRLGAALAITLPEFYRAAGVVDPPADDDPDERPLPAIEDVLAYMHRDPEIVAALDRLKRTQTPAVYDRLARQLAEAWQANGRMMLATWETALAARDDPRDDGE